MRDYVKITRCLCNSDEPTEIQNGLPMDSLLAIAKIQALILTGSTLCANLIKLDKGKCYQNPPYGVKTMASCIIFHLHNSIDIHSIL